MSTHGRGPLNAGFVSDAGKTLMTHATRRDQRSRAWSQGSGIE
jgi:hypothetical protein